MRAIYTYDPVPGASSWKELADSGRAALQNASTRQKLGRDQFSSPEQIAAAVEQGQKTFGRIADLPWLSLSERRRLNAYSRGHRI